jgi:hypothetical protein
MIETITGITGIIFIVIAALALALSLRYADRVVRWDEEINGEARRESERKRNH